MFYRVNLSPYFLQVPKIGTGNKDFECRFWLLKTCYLVAMLYKNFEGICLKNVNRKTCWEHLDISWFRREESMNKQGFWEQGGPIFGTYTIGQHQVPYQRFASIWAWVDENHKLKYVLWKCKLPCLYFGKVILFEQNKKIFFRRNIWIF